MELYHDIRIYGALELGWQSIYSQKLPDQFHPDSIQPFRIENYTQFVMPVNLGLQLKIPQTFWKRIDIFWAPEIQYNVPIGYQYWIYINPMQGFTFDLFRLTFEFKK